MSIARLMQMGAAGVSAGGGDVWTNPDLANASYDSVSFSVAGQDEAPQGIFFKPDGAKLYIIGDAGNDVNEYDLSTPWDISTALYLQRFVVGSQETSPSNMFFKPDGTKMYVIGQMGDYVNEYNLSTAWDVSSASYLQNFSVAAEETTPQGIFFKHDGTKMYVAGNEGNDITEWTLSTAWNISTASYAQGFSVSSQETFPSGVFFNPDGTKMYVIGLVSDNVNEYDLSTGWDVSTASYLQNFSVSSQDGIPTGIYFKSDGSKMYIIGNATDTIYQYSTS